MDRPQIVSQRTRRLDPQQLFRPATLAYKENAFIRELCLGLIAPNADVDFKVLFLLKATKVYSLYTSSKHIKADHTRSRTHNTHARDTHSHFELLQCFQMLPDDWWFLADLCLLLSIAGLVAVLPLISSAPISDISAKPGSNWVVVTTARPHGVGFRPGVQRVLQRLFGSPKIRLWGTGCPLEGKNAWQAGVSIVQ